MGDQPSQANHAQFSGSLNWSCVLDIWTKNRWNPMLCHSGVPRRVEMAGYLDLLNCSYYLFSEAWFPVFSLILWNTPYLSSFGGQHYLLTVKAPWQVHQCCHGCIWHMEPLLSWSLDSCTGCRKLLTETLPGPGNREPLLQLIVLWVYGPAPLPSHLQAALWIQRASP